MAMEAEIAELVDKYARETNKSQSEADVRADYTPILACQQDITLLEIVSGKRFLFTY